MCGTATPFTTAENQTSTCCSGKPVAPVMTCGRTATPVSKEDNTAREGCKPSTVFAKKGGCCDDVSELLREGQKVDACCDGPKPDCEEPAISDEGCEKRCCKEDTRSLIHEDQVKDGCCPAISFERVDNGCALEDETCGSVCCSGPPVDSEETTGCSGNTGPAKIDDCCSTSALVTDRTRCDTKMAEAETTSAQKNPNNCCRQTGASNFAPAPALEIYLKSDCCSRQSIPTTKRCCSSTSAPSIALDEPAGCCPANKQVPSSSSDDDCCQSDPLSIEDDRCGSKQTNLIDTQNGCCSGPSSRVKAESGCCSNSPGPRRRKSAVKPAKANCAPITKDEIMCPCCVESMLKLNLTVLDAVLSRVNEAQERFKRCCIAFADLCCAKSKTETGCCETACQGEDGSSITILEKHTGPYDADQSHGGLVSGKHEQSEIRESEDDVTEEIVLEVIGMDCPDCLSKVTRAVQVLSGTKVKNADGVRGLVSLSYDPRLIDLKAIQTFTARASGFKINILDRGDLSNGAKALLLPLSFRETPPTHVLDKYEIVGSRNDASRNRSTRNLRKNSTKGADIDIVLRLDQSDPIRPRDLLNELSEYGVTLRPQSTDQNQVRIHRDLRNIAFRTLASLILTIPILVLVWSPQPLTTRTISHSVQLGLATLVVIVAWPVYSGSFRSAYYLHRADLGVLTSFSTLTSYIFSVVAFGFQIGGRDIGEPFFETVGLLITLIFAGRTLQAGTRKFGLKAVDNLGRLQPENARLVEDGKERNIDVRLLHYDDVVRIKSGEIIPTDGVVIRGNGTVDESSLTGESVPVVKSTGSSLTAGTELQDGQLDIAVTHLIPENSISTIVDAVSSSSTGSEYQDLADRMAGWLLPIAGICCLAAFIGWMLVERLRRGQTWGEAVISGVGYAIAIAAVSCPCALAIAVTLVTSVSMATTVQDGILFRSTQALLTAHAVKAIAFDKTGTLSQGVMTVQQSSYDQDPLSVQLIHAVTATSKHPVSETARRYIESHHELPSEKRGGLTDIEVVAGKGVTASFFGFPVMAGSADFIDTTHHPFVEEYLAKGMTILVITLGRQLIGLFGMKDQPRPGVSELIAKLTSGGKDISLVSGDNHSAVHSFATVIGISPNNVHASQTPVSKGEIVQRLKDSTVGRVAFVGDGINDTIALSTADISIATGSASNASSQIIILSSDVPSAIRQILSTSQMTRTHVVVSLTFCGIYFAVAILLASGVVGWRIPPAFAGLGELVSILPVLLVGGHLAMYKSVQRRWRGVVGGADLII